MSASFLSRRSFLTGAACTAGLAGCRIPFGTGGRAAVPRLRFGVVSDIHLTRETGEPGDRQDQAPLLRAFGYFRDRRADAVVLAGDMADSGLVAELQSVANVWEQAFPGSRLPDGSPVERVFVTGNHDWEGCNYGKLTHSRFPDEKDFARRVLRTDYAGNWERIFKEPYRRVYLKRVKGYAFVGAHWHPDFLERSCRGQNDPFNSHVAAFYAEHGEELKGERPFFHIQHPHPRGTVYGPWASCDDGTATRILSGFPNAVAISGHSHLSLTDERSVWQGAFTSIGAGSLLYATLPKNELPFPGYENVGGYPEAHKLTPCRPQAWQRASNQGLFVTVYDDRLEIERLDFGPCVPIGPMWTVPLGGPRPECVRRLPPLVFAPDASLRLYRSEAALTVEIPPARDGEGRHAYAYEVRAVDGTGTVRLTRRVLAEDFNLPAVSHGLPTRCRLPLDGIPQSLRLDVRPRDSYGQPGDWISAYE